MRPTRAAAVRLDTARWNFSDRWFRQQHFADGSPETYDGNRDLVDTFCAKLRFADDPGDSRRHDGQIHPFADVELEEVLRDLMMDFKMTEEDNVEFTMLRVLLQSAVDDETKPSAVCRVHQMALRAPRERFRTLDQKGAITLFQGANSRVGYGGDTSIRANEGITVQIHRLDLRSQVGAVEVACDVPALAIWVPANYLTVVAQR